jgi:hypothetical protein
VAGLIYSPEADEVLDRLEADPGRRQLLGRINTALDRLEADPGDARCRRRRFNTLGVWGIAVVSDDEEWLILWEPLADGDVLIHHITPAP